MPEPCEGLPALPVKRACCEIVGFLRRMALVSRPICILGLSGGVDSALVAYLIFKAVGRERIRAVILPCHMSDKKSTEDALLVVKLLDISYQIIDITPCIDSYFSQFPHADNLRRGNKIARERMSVLYDMAALHNGIVVGTGNKSECMLGYFTKYGDGGVDIEPIAGLYKTHIYQLARYLDIPENIIKKHPTADLWPGQRDEEDLGITYEEVDKILYRMIDIGECIEDIAKKGFDAHRVQRIAEMVRTAEHKRNLPPYPDLRMIFKDKQSPLT